MLVIHGAKNYRVVDTQGISTSTALQRKGIPSKFLYFLLPRRKPLGPATGQRRPLPGDGPGLAGPVDQMT